jgi:methylenetetrahydrofolate dehydrogenase (NADP+)/methenyltetrahydrofolate cyclohydrolase
LTIVTGGIDLIYHNRELLGNSERTIKLIPGDEIASRKRSLLQKAIARLDGAPTLHIIQVGDDPASSLYVSLKLKFARRLGIKAESTVFKKGTAISKIQEKIVSLNQNTEVNGIMVQAPIQGLDLDDSLQIFNAIAPSKDVDGLTNSSLGKLYQIKDLTQLNAEKFFVSATPLAALDCLNFLLTAEVELGKYSEYEKLTEIVKGKKALIINRSNIVGKPLLALLQAANATVTLAHSRTKNVQELIAESDILLPATGVPALIRSNQLREGQIAIDIGINNDNPDEKVKGDIMITEEKSKLTDSEDFKQEDVIISPVPGGVGPLTVVNLLYNTYLSYINSK